MSSASEIRSSASEIALGGAGRLVGGRLGERKSRRGLAPSALPSALASVGVLSSLCGEGRSCGGCGGEGGDCERGGGEGGSGMWIATTTWVLQAVATATRAVARWR